MDIHQKGNGLAGMLMENVAERFQGRRADTIIIRLKNARKDLDGRLNIERGKVVRPVAINVTDLSDGNKPLKTAR
jgi:hypothetical protein